MASVGIAVDPPLLADLLVRLLWRPDLEVHHHDPSTRLKYDIAVTSGGLRQGIAAGTVIRLPDAGQAGWGSVVSSQMSHMARIQAVDDVIYLLDGLLDDKRPD